MPLKKAPPRALRLSGQPLNFEVSQRIGKMATETVTKTDRQRNKPKNENLPPENERYLRACSDIASALVQEHEALQDPEKPKKNLNLNSLRARLSKKHKLSNIPPLTAIIAAIPEHYKKYILPKLIAKPIRKFLPQLNMQSLITSRERIWYCSRCRYVQTSPMSPHCLYGQHLRLLSWRSRFGFRILYAILYRLRTYIYASYPGTIRSI